MLANIFLEQHHISFGATCRATLCLLTSFVIAGSVITDSNLIANEFNSTFLSVSGPLCITDTTVELISPGLVTENIEFNINGISNLLLKLDVKKILRP